MQSNSKNNKYSLGNVVAKLPTIYMLPIWYNLNIAYITARLSWISDWNSKSIHNFSNHFIRIINRIISPKHVIITCSTIISLIIVVFVNIAVIRISDLRSGVGGQSSGQNAIILQLLLIHNFLRYFSKA